MLSDLPKDMAEEVLSKLPVTSLRGVRFTCKKWNTLSRDRSFIQKYIGKAKAAADKKQRRKEFQVVMMLDFRVSLYSVNLFKFKPCIEPVGKLISLEDADRVDISNISQCDGLLLCITKDLSSLVVWNPCSGQTRWIQPRISFTIFDRYALGYERNNKYLFRKHKVLRFVDDYDLTRTYRVREFEIYNFDTNTWKALDVSPDWDIRHFRHGVSLNGNTYWYAREKVKIPVARRRDIDITYLPDFLLSFDFTTERFGPRLPLPFRAFYGDIVILSSVRETQLAVLRQKRGTPAFQLKIWISSHIEPDSVSWNKLFLKVDMYPLTGFHFYEFSGSFFVDEKTKVAVVLDKDRDRDTGPNPTSNYIAYIIGKKGYFKKVDLGESTHPRCWPLACPYVPSSVQIMQAGNQNLP